MSQDSTTGGDKRGPVKLSPDGRNWISFRTTIPITLQYFKYAWEVTTGTIEPDQEGFADGNRVARLILFNSLSPRVITSLFYGEVDTITAPQIWKLLDHNFNKKSGIIKDIQVSTFMNFKFSPSKTAIENVNDFKALLFSLEEMGAKIDQVMACARLVDSLPEGWESFAQAWSSRTDDQKDIVTLGDLIIAEDLRQKQRSVSAEDQITALASRMRIGRNPRRNLRGGFQPRNVFRGGGRPYRREQTRYVQRTDVLCFRCGRPDHMQRTCNVRPGRRAPAHRPMNNTNSTNQPAQPRAMASRATVFMVTSTMHSRTAISLLSDSLCQITFVVDSGASEIFVNEECVLHSYKPFATPKKVRMADDKEIEAMGSGTLKLSIQDGEENPGLVLNDVVLAPALATCLLSVSKLASNGFKVTAVEKAMHIQKDDIALIAKEKDGLYVLRARAERFKSAQPKRFESAQGKLAKVCPMPPISLYRAHETLAHYGHTRVKQMLAREGIPYKNDFEQCASCLQGKMAKKPNRRRPATFKAQLPGVIHADVCEAGAMSLGGARAMLTLVEEYSGYVTPYLIKHKHKVPEMV